MTRSVWCLSLLLAAGEAFYLPGVSPKEYKDGDKVEVKVNKLSSSITQLPYDYYSLPFCKPADIINAVENLGEVLHGSVIQNSPYELQMQKPDFKVLCKKDLSKNEARMMSQRIKEDYRVHLIMDNLPAATRMISELPDGKVVTMYDRGYRCGLGAPLTRGPLHRRARVGSSHPASPPAHRPARAARTGWASWARRSSSAPRWACRTSITTCASSSSTTRTRPSRARASWASRWRPSP